MRKIGIAIIPSILSMPLTKFHAEAEMSLLAEEYVKRIKILGGVGDWVVVSGPTVTGSTSCSMVGMKGTGEVSIKTSADWGDAFEVALMPRGGISLPQPSAGFDATAMLNIGDNGVEIPFRVVSEGVPHAIWWFSSGEPLSNLTSVVNMLSKHKTITATFTDAEYNVSVSTDGLISAMPIFQACIQSIYQK